MKPRVLDLFCCAGGAAMGYHTAGFEVVGVDINPQPNYPFTFIQADVMTEFEPSDAKGFDIVRASPPCQGYTSLNDLNGATHPLLIEPVREMLIATGKPYEIENVENAYWDMKSPIMLCGSSFGIRVRRHRLFEASFPIEEPPCEHAWQNSHKPYRLHISESRGDVRHSGVVPVYGGNQFVGGQSRFYKSVAMGIDWMTEAEVNEAIPPAFTRHVAKNFLRYLLTR